MASAKPKSTKSTTAEFARLYRPGVLEHGLKIIAKAKDDAEAKKDATTPEAAPRDEYLRLQAEKIVADVRLEMATEKKQAEAAAKAEEPKLEASRAFAQAYHALLAANAGLEDPDITDEEQSERWRVQSEAERRLFTTPSVHPYQVWQKLEAFETILSEELTSGSRTDSILVLALASIKQDIVNLDLLEGADDRPKRGSSG
jgi:cell division septum initiation protein DivIVA